jgi:hypothetical protein
LAPLLGGFHIHPLIFQARAKGIPMSDRGDQDYALAIRDGRSRKATDGPIEELLILIKLDDVIAGRGTR